MLVPSWQIYLSPDQCDLVHVSSSYSDIIISYVILQSMVYYEYVCINFIKAYLCPYALG